ncbi:MAG: hypothetical protein LBS12_01950 [Prevotellaceae bacterium]|nr:hypothetical protein [Prevotellaceae bacterium]
MPAADTIGSSRLAAGSSQLTTGSSQLQGYLFALYDFPSRHPC